MNAKIKQYIDNVNNGLLKSTSLKILHYAKNNNPITVHHLRKHLKQPHQTITSALNSLMDDGLIYKVGTTTVNMKHYSILQYTDDFKTIKSNQSRRLNIKKLRWLNRIEEMEMPPMLEKTLIDYRNKIQLVNDFKNWNEETAIQ